MALDDVLARRFGSAHARPCADPNTVTCTLWDCQERNRCKKSFNLPPGQEADMHSLTARHFTK